jgi:hypothetical protein
MPLQFIDYWFGIKRLSAGSLRGALTYATTLPRDRGGSSPTLLCKQEQSSARTLIHSDLGTFYRFPTAESRVDSISFRLVLDLLRSNSSSSSRCLLCVCAEAPEMDFRCGEPGGIIGCQWRFCVGAVDRGGLQTRPGWHCMEMPL